MIMADDAVPPNDGEAPLSQEEPPLLTFDEAINDPAVVNAYRTLIDAGMMRIAARADVFCAYCGKHIVYTATGRQGYTPYVKDAVMAHRATCELYKTFTADNVARDDAQNPANQGVMDQKASVVAPRVLV
jgi:hypothetical protein